MVIELRNSGIMADDSCSAFAAGTVDSVKEYYKKLLHGVVTKCIDVVVIGLCFTQLVFVRVHES